MNSIKFRDNLNMAVQGWGPPHSCSDLWFLLVLLGKLKENHYFLEGPFGDFGYFGKTEGKSLLSTRHRPPASGLHWSAFA